MTLPTFGPTPAPPTTNRARPARHDRRDDATLDKMGNAPPPPSLE